MFHVNAPLLMMGFFNAISHYNQFEIIQKHPPKYTYSWTPNIISSPTRFAPAREMQFSLKRYIHRQVQIVYRSVWSRVECDPRVWSIQLQWAFHAYLAGLVRIKYSLLWCNRYRSVTLRSFMETIMALKLAPWVWYLSILDQIVQKGLVEKGFCNTWPSKCDLVYLEE